MGGGTLACAESGAVTAAVAVVSGALQVSLVCRAGAVTAAVAAAVASPLAAAAEVASAVASAVAAAVASAVASAVAAASAEAELAVELTGAIMLEHECAPVFGSGDSAGLSVVADWAAVLLPQESLPPRRTPSLQPGVHAAGEVQEWLL